MYINDIYTYHLFCVKYQMFLNNFHDYVVRKHVCQKLKVTHRVLSTIRINITFGYFCRKCLKTTTTLYLTKIKKYAPPNSYTSKKRAVRCIVCNN